MIKPTLAVLLALSLGFSCPAWAAPELTLEQAQAIALARSRQLTSAAALVSAAHALAIAAQQLPDPVVKLGIDNLPIEGVDRFSIARDSMTMRRLGIMQEMTRADKRQFKSERFEREAEKSLAEKNNAIAAIEREVALTWFERYYAEAMLVLAHQQTLQTQQISAAAQSAYRAGRGSQADVLSAQSALALAENRASELQQRVSSAKLMLARWIDGAAEAALAKPPPMDTIDLSAHNLESSVHNHPEITALSKQEEINSAEARLAQANKQADWNWEVVLQQRGPAYANMVSLGVSFPLQWDQRQRQDQEIAAKLALVEQARAQRDEVLRAHTAELRTLVLAWESSRERHARYTQTLLPLAAQRSQSILAAYRGAKSNLGEVLAAQRDETELRMQTLQLDWDIARLWAQINFIVPSNH